MFDKNSLTAEEKERIIEQALNTDRNRCIAINYNTDYIDSLEKNSKIKTLRVNPKIKADGDIEKLAIDHKIGEITDLDLFKMHHKEHSLSAKNYYNIMKTNYPEITFITVSTKGKPCELV